MNGWTNWDTWSVNLWLTNTESLYNCYRMICNTDIDRSVQRLQEFVESLLKLGTITDDIDMRNVNWQEIVKAAQDEEQYR